MRTLCKKMLLVWMHEQISQNPAKSWLQDSKQPAYSLWVYYTGRPDAAQAFQDGLVELGCEIPGYFTREDRVRFRQSMKKAVGQLTFAQLLEEERKELL